MRAARAILYFSPRIDHLSAFMLHFLWIRSTDNYQKEAALLEKVDLKARLGKNEYDERMNVLRPHLFELQRVARGAGIPTMVVFEGWDAAGKGTCIGSLLEWLDPRWFKVHATYAPLPEEIMRPWMWRFWLKTPNKGELAIFDRSWYGRVMVEHVDKLISKEQYERAFIEIRQFEEQLANDGNLITKFWLHISSKEQKKRFRAMEKDPNQAWKVAKEDWKHHKQYEEYELAVERMLAETSTHYAPWVIVEATCLRHARVKIAETLVRNLELRLTDKGEKFMTMDERAKLMKEKAGASK
jgi:polyphosphate kinase 2 (PPK2 family)